MPAGAGKTFNRAELVGTEGQLLARYDKIHLYDAFSFTESATVTPGHEPVVIRIDGVGVGVTLCYDIRFPALFTELADRGASVITVSASWGAGPGKLDQWQLLSRARALDTTCFVAAAGQAYPGPELAESSTAPTGVGGSLVASPVGEVLVSAGSSPQLLVCDLDIGGLEAVRKTLPVLNNRAVIAQTGRIASR